MRIIASKQQTVGDWWNQYSTSTKEQQEEAITKLNDMGYTFGHGAIWDKEGRAVTKSHKLVSQGLEAQASEDTDLIMKAIKKSVPAKYVKDISVISTGNGTVDEGVFLIQLEQYLSQNQIDLMSIMFKKVAKSLGANISFAEADERANVTIWYLNY